MKLLVNKIEVKTIEDLEKAMLWENQKGEYSEIIYMAENKDDYKKFPSMSYKDFLGLYTLKLSNEEVKKVVKYFYFRNWYNENQECLKPYNDGFAYDKELSIKYNVKQLAKQLQIA